MIYINSKGERQIIESLNDHHLKAAITKVEMKRNVLVGILERHLPRDEASKDDIVRYLDIIHANLVAELESRIDPSVMALVEAEYSGGRPEDMKRMASFISQHFTLKK